MIIECINCSKKFSVNSDLIPSDGRTIQCGSCNHIWFFKKDDVNKIIKKKTEITNKIDTFSKKDVSKDIINKKNQKKVITKERKGSEIVKYKPKKSYTFGKFLSYIIVTIITFIAIIILLDTFKNPLYNFFPNLEFILFSLYETLKDIHLFIKDLI